MLVSLCCSFFLILFFLITCFSCPGDGSGVTLPGTTCVQHRAALASPHRSLPCSQLFPWCFHPVGSRRQTEETQDSCFSRTYSLNKTHGCNRVRNNKVQSLGIGLIFFLCKIFELWGEFILKTKRKWHLHISTICPKPRLHHSKGTTPFKH